MGIAVRGERVNETGEVVVDGTDDALDAIAEEVARRARSLCEILPEALEIQWRPALIPRPDEDTLRRSKGWHSDPTSGTVADPRRLAVRAAVLQSLREIVAAAEALDDAEERLTDAVNAWKGRSA